jgi:hypothetical protein
MLHAISRNASRLETGLEQHVEGLGAAWQPRPFAFQGDSFTLKCRPAHPAKAALILLPMAGIFLRYARGLHV